MEMLYLRKYGIERFQNKDIMKRMLLIVLQMI